MSIHSDLMHSAIDVLIAVQGESGGQACVKYKPAKGAEFVWDGSTPGAEHGAWTTTDSGSLLKVTRVMVFGPVKPLIAGGVTELERDARLTALGKSDWSIDTAESMWGPEYVRLALVRRPVSRFEEQEARAAIR
jgi:hypothetical protein